MTPNNPLQKILEALHHPLPEVLRSFRNVFHILRGKLRKNNQADRNDPRHHHGIGNYQRAERRSDAADFGSLLRNSMLGGLRRLRLFGGWLFGRLLSAKSGHWQPRQQEPK